MSLSQFGWLCPLPISGYAPTLVCVLIVTCCWPEKLAAEPYGPQPLLAGSGPHDSRLSFNSSIPPANLELGEMRRRWFSSSQEENHHETIERVSGEENGPRVPEPMVFDLIRPLGAKRGEAEANVLGLIPLRRKSGTVDDVPDPLGLVRRSPDSQQIEWAPEFELALADGFAIEVEFPWENSQLEAYKAAAQLTFGTAMGNRLIHGAQTIVQYDRDPGLWTTTWLYLSGFRLDDTWSIFGMFGPRIEIGNAAGGANTEILANVTVFADITDRLVGGIETNFGQVINGQAALLVMPQIHYEVSKHWMIQTGVGARFTQDVALPEVGFRVIREF